jgi:hypothetical protein
MILVFNYSNNNDKLWGFEIKTIANKGYKL